MTKHINPFKILALAALFVLPAISHAAGNEDGSEKKKTISKTYTVTSNEKLKIENSFGEVVINTWDKNEFKVDVEVYSKAMTDEKAQSILDQIKVNDSQTDNTVFFKTNIGHINSGNNHNDNDDNDGDDDNDNGDNKKHSHNNHGNNNQEFHVNYVVYMPSSNPLQIDNQFGKTIVPDFKGLVNLTSKFGSLKTGNLDNVQSIDVQFGKADIGHIKNGKVNFQYDDKAHITDISGSTKLIVAFSANTQFGINNNIDELTVNESYSTIKIVVSKDLSADFSIHTSFGEFKNNTDFKLTAEKEDDNAGPSFDKDYTGKSGDGKAKIKIKSSFGEIRLSHNSGKDSDEERNEKPERKEKKERREKKEKPEKDEVNI